MSDLPEGAKPFDRKEIQPCAVCKKGIGHSGAIDFYEVAITQVAVDIRAVQQIAGLEMMMGGHAALAAVFAPTSRIGVRLPPKRMILCHTCFLDFENLESTAAVVLWDDDND